MSDWRHTDEQGRPVYDDDRLLAFALGLDDDRELAEAASGDAELGLRLERMRAEVAAVGGQLDAVVPAPDDRYAGLRDYFTTPPARPARHGAGRWLRILAPVAAVALAVAVGIGVLVDQTGDRLTSDESGSAATSFDAQPERAAGRSEESGTGEPAAGQPEDLGAARARLLARQVDAHAVVVVARATESVGDAQRFTVVRVLKGQAPAVLRLQVVTSPAEDGALYVLFLDPVPAGVASSPSTPASPSAELEAVPSPAPTVAPSPKYPGSPSSGASPDGTRQIVPELRRALAFRRDGDRVLVRRLPDGVDVGALLLP